MLRYLNDDLSELHSELKICQSFKCKNVPVKRTGKEVGINGEITAKIGNELKWGNKKRRITEGWRTENMNQDKVRGMGNKNKIRGKEKGNNARKEGNWKTELK